MFGGSFSRVPGVLSQDIPDLARTAESGSNPLFRWLHRETKLARDLLAIVRAELSSTADVCAGVEKATNTERDLMANLSKGKHWGF
jgi:hypothetical protein